jgi:hypothetical protein
VQQRATPKVRDCAFWKQKLCGPESVIVALIDAALVRVFVSVTQVILWIRKPSVAGSIPDMGSIYFAHSNLRLFLMSWMLFDIRSIVEQSSVKEV